MKIYTIAILTREDEYGQFPHIVACMPGPKSEQVVWAMQPDSFGKMGLGQQIRTVYGENAFAPCFTTREAAEQFMKANRFYNTPQIVELELQGP